MTDLDPYSGVFARFKPLFRVQRAFLTQLSCRHQSLSHHPHIAQDKQHQDLRSVLGQCFVTKLAVTKLALRYAERVFHLGTPGILEHAGRRREMIEPVTLGLESEGVSGQRGECHHAKLLRAYHASHAGVAALGIGNTVRACPRHEFHDL